MNMAFITDKIWVMFLVTVHIDWQPLELGIPTKQCQLQSSSVIQCGSHHDKLSVPLVKMANLFFLFWMASLKKKLRTVTRGAYEI